MKVNGGSDRQGVYISMVNVKAASRLSNVLIFIEQIPLLSLCQRHNRSLLFSPFVTCSLFLCVPLCLCVESV